MTAATTSKLALFAVFLNLGCSDSPAGSGPGGAGAIGVSGATTIAGRGGADGGRAGSGMAGVPGGGAGGLGDAGGLGGAAGISASAGTAGSGGTRNGGITCAPTNVGTGVHEQAMPYGKPPEANVQPAVPTGVLTPLTSFRSTLYGHEFGYRVYVPAQYQRGRRAAVMIVQDGPSHYLGQTDAKFFTNVVMDNLIAEGSVPVTIGLFIDPCMMGCEAKRVEIYDDPSDKFSRFLREEIVPSVIGKDYTVVSDPKGWLGVGFSAGAMTSFSAAWHAPSLFQKIIGHNTSFPAAKDHGADYAQLVPAAENKGFRVSLVSGTMDLSDERGNWLEASTEMEMVLTAKGYPVRLMTGTGGHYPPDQSSMDFPDALRWIWQGCELADY